MKKNIILCSFYIIICITISLHIQAQCAQMGQNINIETITLPREVIYIHTDRESYVAGDYLFFKLYLNNSDNSGIPQISNFVYIILRNENASIIHTMVKVENNSTFGSLYLPDTLSSGVYQIVAYTNYMRNFGEKSFFNKSLLIINRFDKTLSVYYSNDSTKHQRKMIKEEVAIQLPKELFLKIELEKDSFRVREKIRIKIKNNGSNLDMNEGNVSISVKEFSPLIDPVNYKSLLVSQSYIFEDSTEQPQNSNSLAVPSYLPEKKGIYLRGKILIKDEPLIKECIYVSTPDTAANLQYSFTDSLGNFQLLLNNYYIGKDLILKLRNNSQENDNLKIILDDKFKLVNSFVPCYPKLTIEIKRYIFNCQDILKIHKSYHTNKLSLQQSKKNQGTFFPLVYQYPSSVIVPARYIPLNDFKEIISNLLVGVRLVKKKKEYEVYMSNSVSKSFFDYPPTIFLDGVPVDNIKQIIGLSSENIRKIEMCNILKFKGDLNFTGILSIISNRKIIDTISFNSPFIRFKTEKVIDKTLYSIPSYGNYTNQDNNPDFRQLLYWNPDVQLKPNQNCEIEFFASDYLTEYLIEVSGFSKEGNPINCFAKFKVYR